MEVEIEGGCVRLSGLECIPKIHEEGVATPAEAILDEGAGELGLVK